MKASDRGARARPRACPRGEDTIRANHLIENDHAVAFGLGTRDDIGDAGILGELSSIRFELDRVKHRALAEGDQGTQRILDRPRPFEAHVDDPLRAAPTNRRRDLIREFTEPLEEFAITCRREHERCGTGIGGRGHDANIDAESPGEFGHTAGDEPIQSKHAGRASQTSIGAIRLHRATPLL